MEAVLKLPLLLEPTSRKTHREIPWRTSYPRLKCHQTQVEGMTFTALKEASITSGSLDQWVCLAGKWEGITAGGKSSFHHLFFQVVSTEQARVHRRTPDNLWKSISCPKAGLVRANVSKLHYTPVAESDF